MNYLLLRKLPTILLESNLSAALPRLKPPPEGVLNGSHGQPRECVSLLAVIKLDEMTEKFAKQSMVATQFKK